MKTRNSAHLIISPDKNRLWLLAIEAYITALREGTGRVLFLLPDSEVVRAVRREIYFHSKDTCRYSGDEFLFDFGEGPLSDGIVDPAVVTLEGWIYAIGEKALHDCKPVTPVIKKLLLEKLLQDRYRDKRSGFFSSIAHTRGFTRSLLSLFGQFKTGCLAPDDVINFHHEKDKTPHIFGEKWKEIGLLYKSYQEELIRQKLVDREDMLLEGLQVLTQQVTDSHYKNSNTGMEQTVPDSFNNLIIYGFYDFNVLEQKVLKILLEAIPQWNVFLLFDDAWAELFKVAVKTKEFFTAFDPLIETLSSVQGEQNTNHRDLLKDSPFPRIPQFLPDHPRNLRVECLEGNSMVNEIEMIAMRIRRLLDEGEDPEDITVCFRDPEKYQNIIHEVFNRYHIPCRFGSGFPALAHPVISILCEAISLRCERYPFKKLLSFLSFFDGNEIVESCSRISDIIGLYGTEDAWMETLEREYEKVAQSRNDSNNMSGDDSEESSLRQSAEVGEKIVRDKMSEVHDFLMAWKERLDRFPVEGTVEQLSKKAQELPQHLGIVNIVKSQWSPRFIPGALNALEKWEQCITSIQDSPEMVGDKKPITARRFLDILTYSLENSTLDHPITITRSVRMNNVMRERALPSIHLFVGGLVDGDFPRHFLFFDLLDDLERRAINHFFKENRLPERNRWRAEEPLIFYSAISGACQSLTVSYPISGIDSHEQIPSPYIGNLEKTLGNLIRESRKPSDVLWKWDQISTMNSLRNRLVADWVYGDSKSKHQSLDRMNYLFDNGDGVVGHVFSLFGMEYARSNPVKPGRWEGVLEDSTIHQKLDKLFKTDSCYGVSFFGEYGRCPYSFFLERVLIITQTLSREDGLDILSRGKLLHRVLERFHREWAKTEGIPISEKICSTATKLLVDIFRQEYENYRKIMMHVPEIFLEEEAQTIEKMLCRYIQGEVERYKTYKMVPTYFEWWFGERTSGGEQTGRRSEPLRLQEGDSPILLNGCVDRVDIRRERNRIVFRVIDYKSGSHLPHLNEIEKGTNFQLPIYLLAVREQLLPEGELFDGLFISIKSGKVGGNRKGKLLNGEQDWMPWVKRSEECIREFFGKIKKGVFSLNPDNCSRYCLYKYICRRAEFEDYNNGDR